MFIFLTMASNAKIDTVCIYLWQEKWMWMFGKAWCVKRLPFCFQCSAPVPTPPSPPPNVLSFVLPLECLHPPSSPLERTNLNPPSFLRHRPDAPPKPAGDRTRPNLQTIIPTLPAKDLRCSSCSRFTYNPSVCYFPSPVILSWDTLPCFFQPAWV